MPAFGFRRADVTAQLGGILGHRIRKLSKSRDQLQITLAHRSESFSLIVKTEFLR